MATTAHCNSFTRNTGRKPKVASSLHFLWPVVFSSLIKARSTPQEGLKLLRNPKGGSRLAASLSYLATRGSSTGGTPWGPGLKLSVPPKRWILFGPDENKAPPLGTSIFENSTTCIKRFVEPPQILCFWALGETRPMGKNQETFP